MEKRKVINKYMKKIIFVVVILIIAILGISFFKNQKTIVITNFTECVTAGYPVMESYPRQCQANGQVFVEEVEILGQLEQEKSDLIRLTSVHEGDYITSPLMITGEARGTWFFEASFPVFLVNWDGLIIAQGIAQAQAEWMTEDFVPFVVNLEFTKPEYKNNGALIFKKDNPSGLPEHDDALEISIFFK